MSYRREQGGVSDLSKGCTETPEQGSAFSIKDQRANSFSFTGKTALMNLLKAAIATKAATVYTPRNGSDCASAVLFMDTNLNFK